MELWELVADRKPRVGGHAGYKPGVFPHRERAGRRQFERADQGLGLPGPKRARDARFRAVFFLDDNTILARAMNQIIVWRASSWPEIEVAEKSVGAKAQ